MVSKNISNHCQNSTFAYILYMKGQNRAYQKGYYKMTESEFEKNVEQKFDRYCKSVIGNGAKNARRVAENRLKHHMILEDMDENDPNLERNDEYRITYTSYRVLNQVVIMERFFLHMHFYLKITKLFSKN